MLCATPYQSGVARLFTPLVDQLALLAPAVAEAPSMARAATVKPDLEQARASLVNAWGTELLLAFGGQLASRDDELLRVMNNWAVVQTYYVGYHAIQALVTARGQPRPDSHPKTQAQFATSWADRSLHLPPWTLGARDGGWCNPPPYHAIDDTLSPWAACAPGTCWDLAAKALRTTREETLKQRILKARERKRTANRTAWREEEHDREVRGRKPRPEPTWPRPQLSLEEKRVVNASVRSFTVLDYLYRLRIKTNYEDAGMFIDGPEDQLASSRVHRSLVALAGCTLLLHELHIAALVGRARILNWADDWLGPNAHGQTLGLVLRRDLLAAHAPT